MKRTLFALGLLSVAVVLSHCGQDVCVLGVGQCEAVVSNAPPSTGPGGTTSSSTVNGITVLATATTASLTGQKFISFTAIRTDTNTQVDLVPRSSDPNVGTIAQVTAPATPGAYVFTALTAGTTTVGFNLVTTSTTAGPTFNITVSP